MIVFDPPATRRLLLALVGAAALTAACATPSTLPSAPSEPAATPSPAPAPATTAIATDRALFSLVTDTQPFSAYPLFPNLNAGSDGILTASSAHQPLIRVRLNAMAAAALQNGRLPSGAEFPDGSVIFKEVLSNSRQADVFAVMYKDRSNANAGNGWLWAEYRPGGDVVFSITNRGNACTACHSLDRGPANDFVRIFERQL